MCVAVPVKERRKAVLPFTVGLGRNVRRCAAFLDLATVRVGVVALVGAQDVARARLFEQRSGGGAIGHLPADQYEGERWL